MIMILILMKAEFIKHAEINSSFIYKNYKAESI